MRMKHTFPRLHRHLAARFAPDTQFGLHLTVGLLCVCLGAWLFAEIAGDVVAKAHITLIDQRLADWFHRHAASGWTPWMIAITHLHAQVAILLMAAVLGLHFYRRQAHYWLASLVLAVPGGLLLNVLLKYIFQRARPRFDDPLLTLSSYSFPSGHAAGAVLLYGMLAAYLVVRCRSWRARLLIVAAAAAMMALVALTRVYLGMHFLSDVLGAMAVSGAWLSVCITAMSTLRRRHAIRTTE
jgi:membrane-associated phospholipid phosphatase